MFVLFYLSLLKWSCDVSYVSRVNEVLKIIRTTLVYVLAIKDWF